MVRTEAGSQKFIGPREYADIAREATRQINRLGCPRGIFMTSVNLPRCRYRHRGNDSSYPAGAPTSERTHSPIPKKFDRWPAPEGYKSITHYRLAQGRRYGFKRSKESQ